MESDKQKIADIYISDTEIFKIDDPYMLDGTAETQIPEIHQIKTITRQIIDGVMFHYKIKLHTQHNVVQRKTYQVVDWLGDIGGLLSILKLVGFIIAKEFS